MIPPKSCRSRRQQRHTRVASPSTGPPGRQDVTGGEGGEVFVRHPRQLGQHQQGPGPAARTCPGSSRGRPARGAPPPPHPDFQPWVGFWKGSPVGRPSAARTVSEFPGMSSPGGGVVVVVDGRDPAALGWPGPPDTPAGTRRASAGSPGVRWCRGGPDCDRLHHRRRRSEQLTCWVMTETPPVPWIDPAEQLAAIGQAVITTDPMGVVV